MIISLVCEYFNIIIARNFYVYRTETFTALHFYYFSICLSKEKAKKENFVSAAAPMILEKEGKQ